MSKISLRSKKISGYRNSTLDTSSYNLKHVSINNRTYNSIIISNSINTISIDEPRNYNDYISAFATQTIRIGYQNGVENSRNTSVFIGKECCYSNVITAPFDIPSSVICIGNKCGKYFKGQIGTCIGYECGTSNQGVTTTAIGYKCGSNSQSSLSICIGYLAGSNCQSENGLSIGYKVGMNNTSNSSFAIGNDIGISKCGIHSLTIGNTVDNPPDTSVCIGNNLYFNNSSVINNYSNSICIGNYYNINNTGTEFEIINIGNNNFSNGTGRYSLCIGNNNGNFVNSSNYLGQNSICIGNYNSKNQQSNSIVIGTYNGNKQNVNQNVIMIGNGINTDSCNSITFNTYATDCISSNTLFINGPIRGSNLKLGVGKLWYDNVTKEVFYSVN